MVRETMCRQAMRIESLANRNRAATRRADVLISLFYDLSERELSLEEVEWKKSMERMRVDVARWGWVLEGVKEGERGIGVKKGGCGVVEGLEGVYEELVREKQGILKVYKRFEGISDEVMRMG
jgi:hypothetical protein